PLVPVEQRGVHDDAERTLVDKVENHGRRPDRLRRPATTTFVSKTTLSTTARSIWYPRRYQGGCRWSSSRVEVARR
ncbi:MAG TPA: hypothetical protein VFY87_04285, partial [Geminicoccaceae bacterium]|nr:hypothetical protein [Geminicoccaceae bacterium]